MADVQEGGCVGGVVRYRTRGAPLLAQVLSCSQIKSGADGESSNPWIITPGRSEEILRHLTATLELCQQFAEAFAIQIQQVNSAKDLTVPISAG